MLINRNFRAFHNLKKFSAISRFKFTIAVQKDLGSNVLPGCVNYRMKFAPARGPQGQKKSVPKAFGTRV
jgi:hypothetical protein